MANVIEEIAAERERQKSVEGWTPEHDDEHSGGELSAAASCYAAGPKMATRTDTIPGSARSPEARIRVPILWPWGPQWWNPKDVRKNLIRAAALIVAEIERLDRAKSKRGGR